MNYLEYIKKNSIETYDDLRNHFMKEPFRFSVYDKDDLAIIMYNQDKEYNDKYVDLIRQCNGLIVEKNNIKNIVCYGLDKCEEVYVNTFERITKNDLDMKTNVHDLLSQTRVYNLIDGTLIKLFYYKDEWKVATTKMIDAYSSYWNGNLSFGEMFDECAKEYNLDESKLNKECTYVFMICHKKNRIVAKNKTNKLYHVFTRNNKTFKEEHHNIGIKNPKLGVFWSFQHVIEELQKLPYYIPGYMIYNEKGERIKLHAPNYNYVKSLKGNELDMFSWIFTLKQNERLENFVYYYPEYVNMVDYVERRFHKLCSQIHDEYVMKYILKYNIKPVFKKTVYELHNNFKKTKLKTTQKEVERHLMTYPPKKLSFLIRNYDLDSQSK